MAGVFGGEWFSLLLPLLIVARSSLVAGAGGTSTSGGCVSGAFGSEISASLTAGSMRRSGVTSVYSVAEAAAIMGKRAWCVIWLMRSILATYPSQTSQWNISSLCMSLI